MFKINGYELYKKAAIRLGYANGGGEIVKDTRQMEKAKEFINQISADLSLDGIKSLSDPICCSIKEEEALCCGVAMLMSLSEDDAQKNRLFTQLYNAKRGAALSAISSVEDTLPIGESGGV